MNNIETISKNLIDILRNQYCHSKGNRSDQHAEFNDFRERFIEKCSEDEIIQSFSRALIQLSIDETGRLLWLASSYNIQFFRAIPDLLPLIELKKREKLLSYYFRKTNGLSPKEIGLNPTQERLIEEECKRLKITPN